MPEYARPIFRWKPVEHAAEILTILDREPIGLPLALGLIAFWVVTLIAAAAAGWP